MTLSDTLQYTSIAPNAFIHAPMKEPCLLLDKTYWLQNLKCMPNGAPHHPDLELAQWYKKILGDSQQAPQVF